VCEHAITQSSQFVFSSKCLGLQQLNHIDTQFITDTSQYIQYMCEILIAYLQLCKLAKS
jgi:hypothetical protein